MNDNPKNPGDSRADVEELRRRLAEAEGTLDAIHRGMVDAFVVEDRQGERVYTLKGAEKAYSVFIETINEGLVVCDSSNNILYSNTAFAHLVGSSPDRVSGSSAHRFIKEEDRPLFDRLVAQSIGGQTGRREFSVLTETGDLVPMLLSFSDLEIGGLNGACIILTDLTEQKHAAHDLREQYSMLSGIVESSNSPIFSIDADYLYSTFNNAHAATMKALYDVDIEPGKSILACMTVEEDRIEAKRNLDRALQGEQFVEAAYSGDEGLSRKYFEVTHNPIRNGLGEVTGVAVFSSDQTESKQAEQALRKSEEYYRLLFDNAGEAILACDSELILTDINRIGCELIGYGREELVGNNILELGILHPGDMENASTAIRRLFDGEDRTETESTFIRKDGATRLAVVTGAAIRDPDGSLRSFIDICHDITEERRVVGELLESRAALAKQAQELKDMLAIASHELRHPATIFKGYSHILLENAGNLDSEVARDALMSIDSASDRLARTINQLMDASRIERGEMSLRLVELEPCTLLDGIAAEFESTGANVVTSDKTGAGAAFEADREKLRSVLGNLVENAIKFSPDGSPVEVCVEAVSGGFLFSVCDKGPGISEEHAELVLERFYQVEDVEHHSIPGIGLGLHIAKTIVDEHGGWIRHRPREGGGSVFEFFIPEHPKAEVCPETERERVKAELSPPFEMRPPDETLDDAVMKDNGTKRVLRVVVIDDDRDIVKVNIMMLKSRGYEAIAAYGGEEGLEVVRREAPDVVLLDIMMPGLDGLETCRRLKSDERTCDIPVIFVTARTAEECSEDALAAGGNGFLSKPFKPDELFESVERVCGAVRT